MTASIASIASRPLLTCAALAALTISPTAALAGPPSSDDSGVRHDREQKTVQSRSSLLDTRVKAAKEQARPRTEAKPAKSGFGETRRPATEAAMADRQIVYLKKLVATTDKTQPEYPDYLFRIADHQLEKKAFFELQAGALYEPIHTARETGRNAQAKQLDKQQRVLTRRAKASGQDAVKALGALVDDPALSRYGRRDHALYLYAFELGQLGQDAPMQKAYRRLITDHPDSEFLPQAYLAFADHYFGKGEIQPAIRLYEKVIQFKDNPVYAYALYRLAWCHLNPVGIAAPKYDKSLDYFVKTIDATVQGRAGSESAGRQLRRDARRDLARAYVHAGQPGKAWAAIQRWGRGPKADEDDRKAMMSNLANIYFGEGGYTASTHLYEQLQAEFPEDPEVCDWQGRVVVNSLATDDKRVQWREIDELAANWSAMASSKHPHKHKKAVRRRCRDLAHDALQSIATTWHDEASKTGREDTWELAAEAYEAFLRTFPRSKDAYEIGYWAAELSWSRASMLVSSPKTSDRTRGLETFRRAHEQFVAVLDRNPRGKHTKAAAYAQMLALKNALEYDETGGKKARCRVDGQGVCVYPQRRRRATTSASRSAATGIDVESDYPITEYVVSETQMIEAYDRYIAHVRDSDDAELAKISYHRILMMVSHNRYAEAIPLLEKMIVEFDGTVYAVWCAEMLVDGLTLAWQDDRNGTEQTVAAGQQLHAWGKRLAGMKLWKHPSAGANLHAQVPTLLAGIKWREADAFRLSGVAHRENRTQGDPEGFAKCAEVFVQVYNEHAEHGQADTLLWNAAECSQAAYRIGQAINLRKLLLARFPESKHYRDTLRYLGESYQAVAWYEDAAEQYETFGRKFPKDSHAPEALNNAYLFRVGLGQAQAAAEDLDRYEKLYRRKNPKKAAGVFWSKRGLLSDDDERLAHARDYIQRYANRGGADRRAVAEATIGQILWRRSCTGSLLFDSCVTLRRQRNSAGLGRSNTRRQLEEEIANRRRGRYQPPRHCGSSTQGLLEVHQRDPKLAATAQKHLQTAIDLAEGELASSPDPTGPDGSRQEELRDALGMSMLYQADRNYEVYLDMGMPQGLNFHVEEWLAGTGVPRFERRYRTQLARATEDKAKLTAWFEKKDGLGAQLLAEYAQVRESGSPAWILAAAARSGALQQNFADQLYRAEVPRHFKTQDQTDAYCGELGEIGMKVEARALEAFQYCLGRSTEFSFFSEYSRLCEDELQQRDAELYPATNEILGRSTYTASKIGSVGVRTDLPR